METVAASQGSAGRGLRAVGTIAVVVLLAGGLSGVAGCKGTPKAADSDLMNTYRSGNYSGAYRAASEAAESASGSRRETARFVAGMSAYQLGRADTAMRYLRPLSDHDESSIAGHANATLGLILARRSEHERAIDYFRKAVADLKGPDSAQAYYHMGVSEQKLGRWSSARLHMQRALKATDDAGFRQRVRERLKADAFTMQLGAFSDRSNAERLARKIRQKAEGANLGTPRIVPSRSSGGSRLYLVQVGRFQSEAEAKQAMARVGATNGIITPLADR